VVAGGSILIWGRLRGIVHAGAEGDASAIICALALTPTQLRIAGQIAIPPAQTGEIRPEVARLVDGKVVAEPWNVK
jgi:septum site-determining protein MinC